MDQEAVERPSRANSPLGRAAFVSVILWGRIRWLCVIFALAVAIGLLGSDYRWLSDIVAGAIVGVTTGVVAAKIGRRNLDTV